MAATKLKKKQNLHGEGIHIFDLVTGLLDGIWNEITSYQGQEWDLPKSKKSLESLIGKDETEKLYGITDTKLQNIYLRNLLAAPLRDDDHNKRIKAMDWIVVYWGRIAKGKEAHKEWVSELKDYDDASVENFIKLKKNKRVSSWSKILAFYDSENYAIFDTRVAISLNTIFDKLGYDHRFFMPQSRDEELNDLFKSIRKHVGEKYDGQRPKYLGYSDYLRLLKTLHKKYPSSNILDLEMRLFANSERLGKEFAKKYDISYKESE